MPRPRLGAAVVSVALLVVPRLAQAGGTEKCIAASERAQELKNAGKLTAARDELAICGSADCPKIVQTDCSRWMVEVLASLPSVVPAAKDTNGRDVVDARLFVDGKPVTELLDGKPVAVDPGAHVFRFEAAGKKPEELRVAVRAGEQNRIVSVTFADAPAAPDAPAIVPSSSSPSTTTSSPSTSTSSFPVFPVVIGAAGLALLGVALYLDLDATSQAHDLRRTCAPNCFQGDVDDIERQYLFAGIGAGVGAAALVAAGVLYFMHKGSKVGLTMRPTVDGAIAQGRITF